MSTEMEPGAVPDWPVVVKWAIGEIEERVGEERWVDEGGHAFEGPHSDAAGEIAALEKV